MASLITFFYGKPLAHDYSCELLSNVAVDLKKEELYTNAVNGTRALKQLYGLFVDAQCLPIRKIGLESRF